VHDRQIRRKRLDDAAFGDGAMAALADDTVELTSQGGEVCNLSVDFREVFTSNDINGFARAAPLIGKAEQLADLRKRKAEITRSADEAQPA
jgi:hypothetical protein